MRMIETPPGSADEFEVILDDDERLVVRRHSRWVQRLTFPVFMLVCNADFHWLSKIVFCLLVGIPMIFLIFFYKVAAFLCLCVCLSVYLSVSLSVCTPIFSDTTAGPHMRIDLGMVRN